MKYPRAPLPATQQILRQPGLDARLAAKLDRQAAAGLARRCPPIAQPRGVRYQLDGANVLGFCSNDYLGLAQHPAPAAATSGATGSRLVSGDRPPLRSLEAAFAGAFEFEDALLFPSGYQANVSVLSAILEADDLVHSDALNHASLIDGIRLSAAQARRHAHATIPSIIGHTTNWWITESCFSMDGDQPALEPLNDFQANAGLLYLDEAHAFGLGPGGIGMAQQLEQQPAVTVIPLGKAMGCGGAFVCGSRTLTDFLRTNARGFVYSTAPAPPVVEAIRANLGRLCGDEGDRARARLARNQSHLSAGLETLHLERICAWGPIFPLIVGTNSRALAVAEHLRQAGFHVQPIRYPTVPKDQARLRLTVSALHDPNDIDALVDALRLALAAHP